MTESVLGIPTTGLEISGVLYNYTTIKTPSDPMLVHVQNEDTQGGYIFRETDDWTGLPGNTISKYVPVELSPASRWGRGSIEVDGLGQVTDPRVIYTYRFDPCGDPQSDPSCDGYVPPIPVIPEIQIYSALDDSAVDDALEETNPELYEDEDEDTTDEETEEEEVEERIEEALAAAQNAVALATGTSQEVIMASMNGLVNLSAYYNKSLAGGSYPETRELEDSILPENPRGLRNGLAQQLLHEEMVSSQYER